MATYTLGEKCVTEIIDLTPVCDKTGAARLLDMAPLRSKAVRETWLSDRHPSWSRQIGVVAIKGSTSFKTATARELPAATAVVDPLHVVKLAGDALDQCRRRIQQAIPGPCGVAADPLQMSHGTPYAGFELLAGRQWGTPRHRSGERRQGGGRGHVGGQRIMTPHCSPGRAAARANPAALIESLRTSVPALLIGLRRLGRTLNHLDHDILAYFDRSGRSNGPAEAISGRPRHLCSSALAFRNLTHYIARSSRETAGFRPQLQPPL